MKLIVTHPGQAHRDDLLSVALALAVYGKMPVQRREVTPDELQDPEVLVLDVGGEHNPERLNFDHHQRGREESPECALSLFVEYLGETEAFQLQQWWEPTVLMDVQGPFATAKKLGLSSFPWGLLSPVEKAIQDMFEAAKPDVSDSLLDLLRAMGVQLLESVRGYKELYDSTREAVVVTEVDGVQCLILSSDNTTALQQLQGREFPEAGMSLSWDDRGSGWALYRFNDHTRVDFAVLDGDSAVLFAHKGGFIAKTHERLTRDELMALVARAVQ